MLLPISSSIDCFLFQILFHIRRLHAKPAPLQRSISILFSAQTTSAALRNYRIRKLLGTTLVSSSERCGEGARSLREEAGPEQRPEDGRRTPHNRGYVLSLSSPFRTLKVLSGSKPPGDLLPAQLWLSETENGHVICPATSRLQLLLW